MYSTTKKIICQGKAGELLNTIIACSESDMQPWTIIGGFNHQNKLIRCKDAKSGMTAHEALNLITDSRYKGWLLNRVEYAKNSGNTKADEIIRNASNPLKKAAFLASFGLTDGTRAKNSTPNSSGMTVVDCDHIGEGNVERVALKASELPFVLAAFRSPSGDGLKLLCATVKVSGSMQSSKSDSANLQKFYNKQIHIIVSKALNIPFGDDTSLGRESAKIDEDCTEARRGTYIPCNGPIYFIREDDYNYYVELDNYQSVPTDISLPAPINVNSEVKSSRFVSYMSKAIESELECLSNAKSGEHHHIALKVGFALGKYRLYQDENTILSKCADIIKGWIPAATSPETEIRAVSEAYHIADAVTEEGWLAEHPERRGRPQKEFSQIQDIDDIDWHKWEEMDFDIDTDCQPEETSSWSERAVARLLMTMFLKKYRFVEGSRGVNILTAKELSVASMDKILQRTYFARDLKGNPKRVTLNSAIGLIGQELGSYDVSLVDRVDLPTHQLVFERPTADSQSKCECYNVNIGIPTFGMDLNSLATSETKAEAEKVTAFAISRFLDAKAYPDPEYRQQKAEEESAYFFRYLYQALTDPGNKPGCAVAMLSQERGTGKSTLTKDIPTILAGLGLRKTISQSTVMNSSSLRFAWTALAGSIFVDFDDFEDNPDCSLSSTLRSLVTMREAYVERKGVQGYSEVSCSRLLFSTNSPEFLRSLNSGKEEERRFHIFHVANIMRNEQKGICDHTCDEPMTIIRKYLKKVQNEDRLSGNDEELMAFRASLLLSFEAHAKDWEEKTGKIIRLDQALDTAERRHQKDLTLEKNSIAREVAKYLLTQPHHMVINIGDIYNYLSTIRGFERYTNKYIRERMEQSEFFGITRKSGHTNVYLLQNGIQAVSGDDDIEETLDEWEKLSTRDRMETLADWQRNHRINEPKYINDCDLVIITRPDKPNWSAELEIKSPVVDDKIVKFSPLDFKFDGDDDDNNENDDFVFDDSLPIGLVN